MGNFRCAQIIVGEKGGCVTTQGERGTICEKIVNGDLSDCSLGIVIYRMSICFVKGKNWRIVINMGVK